MTGMQNRCIVAFDMPPINHPPPDTIGASAKLHQELRAIVGESNLLLAPEELRTYECDGLTNFRVVPVAVVLPSDAEQVQRIVRVCHRDHIPFVARGSGTGLSGGAMPVQGGIVISLARLTRIVEIDIPNERVVVEPGVINAHVTQRVAPYGYFYAPDPSSQSVCSIGGNVAENSGGAHCLKYGFTTTHVLAMDVILPDGERVTLGASTCDAPGYDLRGVFVGSEGTLGIAVKITLRIMRRPECVQTLLAAFHSTDDAGEAVGRIIAAGILPAAAEMMDRLSILAAEAAVHACYPDCEALLLIELDGVADEVALLVDQVEQICAETGAWELRLARDDSQRQVFWKGRKAAFAAMGRISPNYIVQDGVIPRTALPQTLREIRRLGAAAGLRVANVFHAGDGNLHPLVLYDRAVPGQEQAAEILSADILRLCIRAGGSITGEHGVGFEKREFMSEMYAEPDLQTMQRVRVAFDPAGICNPLKIFPRPRLCGEKPGPYAPHPLVTAGLAELF
ncbi:MAG TPA: FAD-linked oxidase C-terminal domain-containing protein [Tepidisphaeraceae bacterium]|jgi:glycolate oxidase|nr:FAD-linked oxidase C-terminal domain-containing protein [Tepidisphaeraceae bacterium]